MARKPSKQNPSPRRPPRLAVPTADINKLKKLVTKHRAGDLLASWQLGQLADRVLARPGQETPPRIMVAELARRIELIPSRPTSSGKQSDESNLRQMMKLGREASAQQVRQLRKALVPWRGIVYWLGVENPQHRDQLRRKMASGMTNSTQIRLYIKKHFKKPAPPRRYADLDRLFNDVMKTADRLTDILQNLIDRMDEFAETTTKGTGSKVKLRAPQRRQLVDSLDDARKWIGTTRSRLANRT